MPSILECSTMIPGSGSSARKTGSEIMDRPRDHRIREPLADRHQAAACLRIDALHGATSIGRSPDDVGRHTTAIRSECKQQKRIAMLTIPLHRELQQVLAAETVRHVTHRQHRIERPFTVSRFRQLSARRNRGGGSASGCSTAWTAQGRWPWSCRMRMRAQTGSFCRCSDTRV